MASSSKSTGRSFKRAANLTSLDVSEDSFTDLKLSSLSQESLLRSKSKRSKHGVKRGRSRALWKRLSKLYPWLLQLKKPQRRGAEAALSIDGFAALFEQRTGKTWVTGAVLTAERDLSHDVLLVGPLTNLESTWLKFLTENLPWYSVHRDLTAYDVDKKANPTGWRVLLLNPEAVTPIRDKLRRRKWDRFIWDEAQRLKNRTSQSSRDAALIAKSAKRRLALTGTPMDQNPKDLWAMMRFVEVKVYGDVWGEFEDFYLEKPNIDLDKPMGMIQRQKMQLASAIAKRKAPMRKDRLDHFADRSRLNVMRITKEDMGIERAKTTVHKFDLDPKEYRKYKQLEKTMVVKVKGNKIITPLKIVNMGKLQQMTGGHIKDEWGEEHRLGKSKRRALRSLINRNTTKGEPFVIFAKFVWEVHAIEKMIKDMGFKRVAKLWGKIKDIKTDKRRTNMLLGFQRGEFDVMICQQRTGGVGVDLYRARKFFVYSMGHSYIDYDQMLSRGDFLHQTEPAHFFFTAARATIDIDIITGVTRKKSITELFYDRLQRER